MQQPPQGANGLFDAALRWWCAAAVLAGLGLRIVGARQPLDQPVWRQADLWAQARAFLLEDANPFHPRIAWRGTTSGLAESEFPLVSWMTSVLWRIFGQHDYLLRALPIVSGIVLLIATWSLVRRLIGSTAALAALAIVSLTPLAVFTAVSVQSDGVMIAAIVVAVLVVERWTANDIAWAQRRWAVSLGAALAIGGLMKPTALHIGAVIATVIIIRRGWRALLRPAVVGGALIGVGLPVAWAWHARSLYRSTGLSLGISNEHHVAGLELFTKPALVKGIANLELHWVWGLAVIVALYGTWAGRRTEAVTIGVVWAVSAAIVLLIAGRTTGDPWAFYYHVVMVPPMILLASIGVNEGVRRMRTRPSDLRVVKRWMPVVVITVAALSFGPWIRTSVQVVSPKHPSALFECAQSIKAGLPVGSILTSGGIRLDDGGHRVAYDASYMFEWLDRTGWTIAIEDQDLETVTSFAALGARVFIAETDATDHAPGFETGLTRRYPVIARCGSTATVFDLRSTVP